MSDLFGNPEDRFSHNEAQIKKGNCRDFNVLRQVNPSLGLIFLILGLQIFFLNIKVGGGKKIKIITKKFFFI